MSSIFFGKMSLPQTFLSLSNYLLSFLQFIYRSSQCICYKSRQFIFLDHGSYLHNIVIRKKTARENLVGKRRHIGDEKIYKYLFYGYSIKMIEKEEEKKLF